MNPPVLINIKLVWVREVMVIAATKKAELGQMEEKILKIVKITGPKSIIEHLQW